MRRGLAGLCATFALTGCAVGPNYTPPTLETAAAYRNAEPTAALNSAEPWWRAFHDPVLDRLEDDALAQNLDIAAAIARVDQARAASGAARAALLPAGEADAKGAGQRASIANSNKVLALYFPNYKRDGSLYDVTAGASWELDLFGGLRRTDEAARAELSAATVGAIGARMTVAADVADHYAQLRGFQARLRVAEQGEAVAAKLMELVKLRFDAGEAPRRDLDAAEAQFSQARAGEAQFRLAIEAELNALAVLTGKTAEAEREAVAKTAPLPVSPRFDTGRPGDLLRRRPDLIAAERKLAAADARIGAAIADYYPKITLQGLIGYESISTSDLFSSKAAESQGALGIRWRLFDFGRVDAEVRAARGRTAEALAAYRQAVLRATGDVENALKAGAERAAAARDLHRAAAASTRARDAALDANAAGLVSLLETLDAERQRLTAEDQALAADTDTVRAAVALARALGL